jgi:hypothetical protein
LKDEAMIVFSNVETLSRHSTSPRDFLEAAKI